MLSTQTTGAEVITHQHLRFVKPFVCKLGSFSIEQLVPKACKARVHAIDMYIHELWPSEMEIRDNTLFHIVSRLALMIA